MTVELDHLFIATQPAAPGLDTLLHIGLIEGSRNVHPGQGTANRRIFFHNAMLEFLWLRDAHEAQGEPIRRTGLYERLAGQDNATPFGICLRQTVSDAPLPFDTWPYCPPYLPPGMSIPMATNSRIIHEPLLFCIPFGGRPDAYPADRCEPIDHPVGWREITAVRVTVSAGPEPAERDLSEPLRALQEVEGITVQTGPRHLLEIQFDGGRRKQRMDCTPALPLVCTW